MRLSIKSFVGTLRWQLLGLLAVGLAAVAGYFAEPWWNASASGPIALNGSALPAVTSAASAAAGQKNPASAKPAAAVQTERRPHSPGGAGGELWEVANAPKNAGAAAIAATGFEKWRIGGVFQTEAGPEVIVVFDRATPMRMLKVGDLLPNKAAIVAITSNSVTVRTLIDGRAVLVVLDI